MDVVATVLGGVAGLAGGLASGLKIGALFRGGPRWRYWGLNAVAMLIGVCADAAGLLTGQWWLVVAGLAFLGGALTGLKYGFGAVPFAAAGRANPPERDPWRAGGGEGG